MLMQSTLDSDYWLMVEKMLTAICKRPSMYFQSVSEYEAFLLGHENAFEQQGTLVRGEAFRALFTKWLKENKYKNPIIKWETKSWGEIPADFGRK